VLFPARGATGRVAAGVQQRFRFAGADEIGLVGEYDCLHPVARVQFLQEVIDVGLDGRVAYEQRGGDLGVGEPTSDQLQYLAFSARRLLC